MEIDIIEIIVPAAAGIIVGLCTGLYFSSRKTVPVKILQDVVVLMVNFARAISDGKLTPGEKEILLQNIFTLAEHIKEQTGSGGTYAALKRS